MKQIALFLIFLGSSAGLFGQGNPIDDLFDKYSGKEGVTTIYISSRMFQMIAGADLDDEELSRLMSRLKSIRIMSVEDSLMNRSLNFYKELESKLDLSKYEELMVVKEGGKDLKFLIRGKGDRVDEFLMIGGGAGGNMLISIKGELDMNNISEISRTIGIQELKEIEKNQTKKKDEE